MAEVTLFNPDHHFYGPDGSPITLEEWAELKESDTTLRADQVVLPGGVNATLRTVYLGFVDYSIYDARLFGTALISYQKGAVVTQLNVYDSEVDALLSHMRHRDAIAAGFHCHCCLTGTEHQD